MVIQPKERMNTKSKEVIWQCWHEGYSLSDIGRAIDRSPASVFGYLRTNGGIQPAKRKRSRLALSLEEREEISRGLSSGISVRSMAKLLERSPSTLSRQINRNGGAKCYRAMGSDRAAWQRAKRQKNVPLQ